MLGFFLKKAFFDGWDNLFSLIFLNLAFVAFVALGFLVPPLFGTGTPLFFVAIMGFFLLAAVWWSTCVHALVAVSDFGRVGWKELPALLKKAILPGLQFGALSALLLVALLTGLPFYLSRGGLVSAAAAGLLLWCYVLFVLAFQWFLPLRARYGGGFVKNLKKCMVFFFDNAFFSVFVFFYNFAGLLISCLLALLMPGFAGMALSLDDALRLRALKYDWFEGSPESRRLAVPWDELLVEEKELVGKRSLKGMVFPWKE